LNKVEGHEIHSIIGEDYFITVRQSVSTAVDKAYERVAQNPNYWDGDVAYFLYLTIQEAVDEYYPLVDHISNRLNKLEEDLLTLGVNQSIRASVYRLKQNLIALRQMIAPQPEVLSSLIGEERLVRTNENRDLFRHLYERLMRVYDIIDSQQDLSSNVLDLLQSREAQELGKAVNRLTIFSMIFLPLTFIISLFGLNFNFNRNRISDSSFRKYALYYTHCRHAFYCQCDGIIFSPSRLVVTHTVLLIRSQFMAEKKGMDASMPFVF
jgi:magnesium transporter